MLLYPWGKELETQGQMSTRHVNMYDIDILEDDSLEELFQTLFIKQKKTIKLHAMCIFTSLFTFLYLLLLKYTAEDLKQKEYKFWKQQNVQQVISFKKLSPQPH